MPPAERAKMIGGMIEQLAAKMHDNPNDLDGIGCGLAGPMRVQGDKTKAVDAYDHAAALKPGDPGIKLQTAAVLMSGLKPGDELPPRAIALLNEVAVTAPDAPEVLWSLGGVAARNGRPAEARDRWTRLLASLTPGGEHEKMVRAALGQLATEVARSPSAAGCRVILQCGRSRPVMRLGYSGRRVVVMMMPLTAGAPARNLTFARHEETPYAGSGD